MILIHLFPKCTIDISLHVISIQPKLHSWVSKAIREALAEPPFSHLAVTQFLRRAIWQLVDLPGFLCSTPCEQSPSLSSLAENLQLSWNIFNVDIPLEKMTQKCAVFYGLGSTLRPSR